MSAWMLALALVGCRDARVWDADQDGYDAVEHGGDDCDDRRPGTNPGAAEICNGIDDDCDGRADDADPGVDPGSQRPWFVDRDGDGFGDGDSPPAAGCAIPEGFSLEAGDCDDTDATVHPGAPEQCDAVDRDCDGRVDDATSGAPSWYLDADGDGFGGGITATACLAPQGFVAAGGDCDDTRGGVFPGAPELCNGDDDDCDGLLDDSDPDVSAASQGWWWPDGDSDGFGAGTPVAACGAPPGHSATPGDCGASDPTVHPGADERCNGVDDDCDGALDEEAVDGTLYMLDLDNDGFGWTESAAVYCDEPVAAVTVGGDCADAVPTAYPGAPERCNNIDDDCDGDIDDADDDVVDRLAWWTDADEDGYGTGAPELWCTPPGPSALVDGDCDDSRDAVNPDQAEICDDGLDNDCDARVDPCALRSDELVAETTTTQALFPVVGVALLGVNREGGWALVGQDQERLWRPQVHGELPQFEDLPYLPDATGGTSMDSSSARVSRGRCEIDRPDCIFVAGMHLPTPPPMATLPPYGEYYVHPDPLDPTASGSEIWGSVPRSAALAPDSLDNKGEGTMTAFVSDDVYLMDVGVGKAWLAGGIGAPTSEAWGTIEDISSSPTYWDQDGDGVQDVVIVRTGAQLPVVVFHAPLPSGSTTTADATLLPNSQNEPLETGGGRAGDLDGDGYDELYARLQGGPLGPNTVMAYDVGASDWRLVAFAERSDILPMVVPDLDGDGHGTLLVTSGDDELYLFHGPLAGFEDEPHNVRRTPSGDTITPVAVGDDDGDGDPDVLIRIGQARFGRLEGTGL